MILLLSDCSWRKGGKDSIESCENLFCAVGPRCAPITWGSTFQAPRGHSIAAVPICADLIDGNEEHQMPTTRDSSSAAPSCQLHQKGRLDQEARGHSPLPITARADGFTHPSAVLHNGLRRPPVLLTSSYGGCTLGVLCC